eukprot:jgi/Undpi1/4222/HiC_scaffold_16.g07588.m1
MVPLLCAGINAGVDLLGVWPSGESWRVFLFSTDRWSGHMALPGGRQEPGETELQVAVRECREEVGLSLDSSRFELLGRLKDSKTGVRKLGLTVASFVFLQTDKLDVPLVTQEEEVAAAWWVDTALFYPDHAPEVLKYPASTSLKFLAKPPFKALLRLFRVDTLYFRCCNLPPPPLFQARAGLGDGPLPSTSINGSPDASSRINHSPGASTRINGLPDASIIMDDTPDAQGFVLWGLTFGVVSHMVVAAGGPNLVYKDLPFFRFRNTGANFLFRMFYKLTGGGSALIRSIGSSVPVLRLRQ